LLIASFIVLPLLHVGMLTTKHGPRGPVARLPEQALRRVHEE
jgi:hypothetical protein